MNEDKRHQTPSYALVALPRPADREIRTRPILGAWSIRNAGKGVKASHE